jgi:hypothetical protein
VAPRQLVCDASKHGKPQRRANHTANDGASPNTAAAASRARGSAAKGRSLLGCRRHFAAAIAAGSRASRCRLQLRLWLLLLLLRCRGAWPLLTPLLHCRLLLCRLRLCLLYVTIRPHHTYSCSRLLS